MGSPKRCLKEFSGFRIVPEAIVLLLGHVPESLSYVVQVLFLDPSYSSAVVCKAYKILRIKICHNVQMILAFFHNKHW